MSSTDKTPFEKTRFLEEPELICSSCGEVALVSRSQEDHTKLTAKCLTRTCQAFDIKCSIEAKVAVRLSSENDHLELLRWAGEIPIEELERR